MIAVGGFNTSIDKTLEVAELRAGTVNRASSVRAYPGGKGLHVARAVATLGEPACLVGIVDAVHRAFFADALSPLGAAFRAIEVECVRTCLTIRETGGTRATEILEPGPELVASDRDALCEEFLSLARSSGLAVLSGSVPRGFGEDVYARLVTALRAAGVRCLVDASGPLLGAAVAAQPFLVKPNRDELQALLGRPIDDAAAAASAARLLCERGVAMVVVSLGEDGALLAASGRVCHAIAPPQPPGNTVGSGDCLLAGVAVGLLRGLAPEEVLRLGVACGTAQTLSPEHGYVRREHVEEVLPQVRSRWIGESA